MTTPKLKLSVVELQDGKVRYTVTLTTHHDEEPGNGDERLAAARALRSMAETIETSAVEAIDAKRCHYCPEAITPYRPGMPVYVHALTGVMLCADKLHVATPRRVQEGRP